MTREASRTIYVKVTLEKATKVRRKRRFRRCPFHRCPIVTVPTRKTLVRVHTVLQQVVYYITAPVRDTIGAAVHGGVHTVLQQAVYYITAPVRTVTVGFLFRQGRGVLIFMCESGYPSFFLA